MGLLDDAIRDHLDLKRRRGADPAEVERLEREALGPVRRNREPADPGVDEAPAPSGDVADDDDLGHDWGEHEAPAAGPAPAHLGDPSLYDDEAGRPPAGDWPYADAGAEAGAGIHDVADDLYPAAPPAVPRADHPLDQLEDETAEYDVAAEHGHAEPSTGDDDDMLEETPEFLQDTPDHDRLWFEQRPPRDFDFDN